MRADIGTREAITVVVGGICLRGTYHRPPNKRAGTLPGGDANNHIGILFLNPGWQPRAGLGDGAVYWADSFAKIGYPSFRLDMPGLGDSDGDLPKNALELVCHIDAGGHAAILSHAVRNLVQRFGLSGAVVVGHCAGAVSALYAAADSDTNVRGLVLLDPYFHLRQGIAQPPMSSPRPMRIVRQLQSAYGRKRQHLRDWVLRTQLGGCLQTMHDYVRYLRQRARRHTLPKNANLRLIRTWNRLATAGLPMLVFTAPPPKPRLGEFDYFRYFRTTAYSSIVVNPVEGTDHYFVKGDGKETVCAHTERWLRACFP